MKLKKKKYYKFKFIVYLTELFEKNRLKWLKIELNYNVVN